MEKFVSEHLVGAVEQFAGFSETLDSIQQSLTSVTELGNLKKIASDMDAVKTASEHQIKESKAIKLGKRPYKINVVNRIPSAFLDVISAQFTVLQSWVEPMAKMQTLEAEQFRRAVEATFERYKELVEHVRKIDSGEVLPETPFTPNAPGNPGEGEMESLLDDFPTLEKGQQSPDEEGEALS